MATESDFGHEAPRAATPSPEPAKARPSPARASLRQSLRGKGYSEQVSMLSPRATAGDGPGKPVLRQGARSAEVSDLQGMLVQRGASIGVDGVFGPATQRAVKAYQTGAGLAADGVVGPATWASLGGGGGAGGGATGSGPGPSGPGGTARHEAILAKVRAVQARFGALAASNRARRETADEPGAAARQPAMRAGWTDDVADAIAGGVEAVGDAASDAYGTATQGANDAYDAAKGAAANAWDAGSAAAGGAATAVDQYVTGGGGGSNVFGPETNGPSVPDVLTDAANEVKADIDGWARDLKEDYGDDYDKFVKALADLGKPLTMDLDGVETTLDELLGGLDPSVVRTDTTGDDTPDGPDEGAFTLTVTRVNTSTALAARTLEQLKVETEQRSRAQGNSRGSFLFVQPTAIAQVSLKKDSKGRVLSYKGTQTETVGIPRWPEFDKDPNAYHPMVRDAWNEAHTGMVVHEDAHLKEDGVWFNSQELQEKLWLRPTSAIGDQLNKLTDGSNKDAAAWDKTTAHGVEGTPQTVVRIPQKSVVDAHNEQHPEDKNKKM